MILSSLKSVLSQRTRRALAFDWKRLNTRLRSKLRHSVPSSTLLHLGCGKRKVPGFLNVDLFGSDFDFDLGGGILPWNDGVFDAIVSQQVIEHLELESQLRPLLNELARVLQPEGELWLACPDMEAICRSYLNDGGTTLFDDRQSRWPDFTLNGLPTSQMVNVLFHQDGQHINLFDYRLLSHLLLESGFSQVRRVQETDMLMRFPNFPERSDDDISLYVCATQ